MGRWLEFDDRATTSADWAMQIDAFDDATGAAEDLSALEFTLEVQDCGSAVLSASTTAGTITRPASNQIAWRFTAAQMSGLQAGKTYKVGIVHEDGDGNKTQFGVGSLAVVDGAVTV